MPKYCQEKYEKDDGTEQLVCWECTKHVHNAAMITSVKKWLGTQYGGTWDVRAKSYQSNLSSCGQNAVALPNKLT